MQPERADARRSGVHFGYPSITAAWTKEGRQAIKIYDSSIYEVQDPTPTRFSVPPGGNAWFAAGTATAFDSPLVAFTRITMATTGTRRCRAAFPCA